MFLIRDVIDVSLSNHFNLGLLSIDQEMAFDRVGYEYLFKVLAAFAFGDFMIKLLFKGVWVMLKMGWGLSLPVLLG